jgi:hypothetical protein
MEYLEIVSPADFKTIDMPAPCDAAAHALEQLSPWRVATARVAARMKAINTMRFSPVQKLSPLLGFNRAYRL